MYVCVLACVCVSVCVSLSVSVYVCVQNKEREETSAIFPRMTDGEADDVNGETSLGLSEGVKNM